MLIYNYQKEFIGIDESDLKALGFSDLSELRSESSDFADLFVKTPGFVHNFKHVHWIDFVTCAEGSENSKVVIHANAKNFRCSLDIKTAYLVDDPSKKAYIINLLGLRALTHSENEQVSGDVLEKPTPRVSTFNSNFEDDKYDEVVTQEPEPEIEVTHDPYETTHTDTLDQPELNSKVVEDIYEDEPIDLGDELLEIDDIEDSIEETPKIQETPKREPLPPADTQLLNIGSDYTYDPHLASEELGLPVDLIEEFIQDFISQANEFKDDLYNALNDGNTDNVKILSHKLKGVAANLRIEDAFEVLSTINTSQNRDEIKTNMDTFYIIIEKLSGKGVQQAAPVKVAENIKEEISDEDDDLILSFKDDNVEEHKIDDSEVPQKIEMPELADDDFLAVDEIKYEKIEEITLEEEEEEKVEPIKYDKAQAANEIGLDAQSFATLLDDFIIEGESACTEINSAIQTGSADSWRQAAIKLKGMSDNMRIHDFTAELESIIHTQDSNEAKEAIDAISTKLQQISSKGV